MNPRTRATSCAALAATLLLFSQAAPGQLIQSSRPPGSEPQLPPPPRPGQPYVRLRAEPAGEVFALAFSPDGRTLAVCTTNHRIDLWSTETGARLRSLRGADGSLSKLLWSPDGRALAAFSPARRAFYFWDAEAGELRGRTDSHREEVSDVAWAAGHGALLTLDGDKWLRAWDAGTGRLVYERRLKGLRGLRYSPGGGAVLVFREYEKPELLDPSTGEKKGQVGTRRVYPTSRPPLARFSADGKLALWELPPKLTLWDAATGRESFVSLARGRHDIFLSAEFSPDGRLLALVRQPFTWSLGIPNDVQVYDVEAGSLRATLGLKNFAEISELSWGEDGATLAAAGKSDPKRFDGGHLTAVTWRVADGAVYAAFPLEEGRRGFSGTLRGSADAVELLANGRVLLTFNTGSAKFWDARTGERLFRREADHISVSPGRRLVATAARGAARAQLWEAVAPWRRAVRAGPRPPRRAGR